MAQRIANVYIGDYQTIDISNEYILCGKGGTWLKSFTTKDKREITKGTKLVATSENTWILIVPSIFQEEPFRVVIFFENSGNEITFYVSSEEIL